MDLSHERMGSGPALILIHGIGGGLKNWRRTLGPLAERHDVIALDLPGFGTSAPLPAGRAPHPLELATVVGEFLDGLGVGTVHLAGNSLGGWISLELARRGRAQTVTAISPAGFWTSREAAWCERSLWLAVRLGRVLQPVAPALLSAGAGRQVALGQLVAHGAGMTPEEAITGVAEMAAAPGFDATLPAMTGDHFRGAGDVRVPVTIAWGTRDLLLFPREGRRAARALPHARHVPLPGLGHVPMFDDADLVARTILETTARG